MAGIHGGMGHPSANRFSIVKVCYAINDFGSMLWHQKRSYQTQLQAALRRLKRRKKKLQKSLKIFMYRVIPLGLLLCTFVHLMNIFIIDYYYNKDDYIQCNDLTEPLYHELNEMLKARNVIGYQPQWQDVVQNETYVLSANLDSRSALGGRLQVRIIGISDTYKDYYPPTDYCQFWYGDSIIMDSVRVRRFVIQEHHNLRYAPLIYSCALPDPKRIPQFVSITRNRCTLPPNILYIEHSNHSNVPSTQPLYNFTICVAPFVHGFGNIKQLIEFMEVSSALGADNVIFYNYTSDPRVRDVLNYYTDSGRAELLQWKMPVRCRGVSDDTSEIHNFGQVLALNDCFYRNLYKSRYTVVMDLDEVLVPHAFDSWNEAMTSLLQVGKNSEKVTVNYGAILFRNSFFVIERQNKMVEKSTTDGEAQNSMQDDSYIVSKLEESNYILKMVYRESEIWPPFARSKYFLDNKKGLALGIHVPFQFIEPTTAIYILSPEEGLLHHYRIHMYKKKFYPTGYYIQDKHLHKFKERFLYNIKLTKDKLRYLNFYLDS